MSNGLMLAFEICWLEKSVIRFLKFTGGVFKRCKFFSSRHVKPGVKVKVRNIKRACFSHSTHKHSGSFGEINQLHICHNLHNHINCRVCSVIMGVSGALGL